MNYFIASNSIVEENVSVGDGTKIWYFSHISEGAKIGKNCNLGDSVFVGKKVIIGNDVRVGNDVTIVQGVIIRDNVFVGPGVKFTNVRKPKADKKSKKFLDTIVNDGVSIGSNATIVAGVTIGSNVIIADGAVVISDLEDNGFYAGNPATVKKYVEKAN